MNRLEKTLIRTRQTIEAACVQVGLDPDLAVLDNIDQCTDCNIWYKYKDLREDQDGNQICLICLREYGD